MSKEMYQIDQAIRMRTAKEQGIEQGRIKGRIEVAKKMKARGMSVEEIAELTGPVSYTHLDVYKRQEKEHSSPEAAGH